MSWKNEIKSLTKLKYEPGKSALLRKKQKTKKTWMQEKAKPWTDGTWIKSQVIGQGDICSLSPWVSRRVFNGQRPLISAHLPLFSRAGAGDVLFMPRHKSDEVLFPQERELQIWQLNSTANVPCSPECC